MKKTKYEKLVAKYQKPLLKSLKEFVGINSVYDEYTANAHNPFGEGVSKALQYIERLAKLDGFTTTWSWKFYMVKLKIT